MAYGQRFVLPYQTPVDATGAPLPGALLNFYISGTSTRTDTYADQTLATANTNPVQADANGVFPSIFLSPLVTYKVVLTDSSAVEQWTADPVTAALPSYAVLVAGLPDAASVPWMRLFVTDANTPTFGSAVAGSGSSHVPVYSDGTIWRVG